MFLLQDTHSKNSSLQSHKGCFEKDDDGLLSVPQTIFALDIDA